MSGDPEMIRFIKISVALFTFFCAVKGTLDFLRAIGFFGA